MRTTSALARASNSSAASASTGFEQGVLGIADLELGRVHPDGDAPGTRVEVVAGERALATFVDTPLGGEGERMRRDHGTAGEGGRGFRSQGGKRSSELPVADCPLGRLGDHRRPFSIQSACRPIRVSAETAG